MVRKVRGASCTPGEWAANVLGGYVHLALRHLLGLLPFACQPSSGSFEDPRSPPAPVTSSSVSWSTAPASSTTAEAPAPFPRPSASVRSPVLPVASGSSSAGSMGEAPPSSHDPAVPLPPTASDCDHVQYDPRCFSMFAAQVTCPSTFAAVPVGEYCGILGTTQKRECPYEEGVCICAQHTAYCGGVTPTFLQQSGMKWACRPPRRAGDCPDAAANGRRCTKSGQQCSYGGCGTSTQCACVAGRFKCATQHWAPPP